MRSGAKCEAYGEPCDNRATKLVEIKDGKGGWRTLIFCDDCYRRLVLDHEGEDTSGIRF